MIPKQKAEKIFNRYKEICDRELNNSGNFELAKEYSLILINDMLNELLSHKINKYGIIRYNFWQKVKHELNNIEYEYI